MDDRTHHAQNLLALWFVYIAPCAWLKRDRPTRTNPNTMQRYFCLDCELAYLEFRLTGTGQLLIKLTGAHLQYAYIHKVWPRSKQKLEMRMHQQRTARVHCMYYSMYITCMGGST